jgi:hypothetical protein
MIDELRAGGYPVQGFVTTNATKADAIERLELVIESGAVRLVNDPVLVGELQAYELERLPGGKIRYSAPSGMHDDTVMASAIGYHAVNVCGGQAEMQVGSMKLW